MQRMPTMQQTECLNVLNAAGAETAVFARMSLCGEFGERSERSDFCERFRRMECTGRVEGVEGSGRE
eukprot:1810067-Lingulodinium_polyedra.AAC.1